MEIDFRKGADYPIHQPVQADKGGLVNSGVARVRGLVAPAIALVALFLAVGGVATAKKGDKSKWTGADIVDESLTGADIANGSILEEDLGFPIGGGGDSIDPGPVPLSVGQSGTLIESGPFKYVLECQDKGGGAVGAKVTLESTVPAITNFGPVGPGSPQTIETLGFGTTLEDIAPVTDGAGVHVVGTASSDRLFLDHLVITRNVDGSDCIGHGIGAA